MQFTGYSFGSIRVDRVTYGRNLVIDRGKVRKRKKATSRKFRGAYGHTQLSAGEDIPWRYRRLVTGTSAAGALPVLQQVPNEARRRKVDLAVLPTAQAIGTLTEAGAHTNAILHLTCQSLPPRLFLRAVFAAAPRRRAGAGAIHLRVSGAPGNFEAR